MNAGQEVAQRLPLSHAQLRLWFLEQQHQDASAYEVFFGIRIEGDLDVAALRAALGACIERHEPLRTVFVERNGQVLQEVLPSFALDLGPVRADLGADPRAVLARWMAEERRAPLPLMGAPLLRAAIHRTSATEHVLSLRSHHLIFDGWSAPVLLRDLAQSYAASSAGEAAPGKPRMHYRDFVQEERAWLGSAAADDARAYWKERLSGTPVLELPADFPAPAARSTRGERVELSIPAEVVAGLHRLRETEACSLFVVLMSAWRALLHRTTGQADFALGTLMANRATDEAREPIGYFAETVALRGVIGGETTFRSLLREQRERVREALTHQRLPYDEVVKLASVASVAGVDPLIQAAFVFQTTQKGEIAAGGARFDVVKLCPDGSVPETAKFDLTMSLETLPAGVEGMISFSTDRFSRAHVERMASHFQHLLRSLAETNGAWDVPLTQVALLSPDERAEILREGNVAMASFPAATLTARFAAQVAARPEASAVTFEGESLTYRALDARAEQVARRLRSLGVGPEVLVGVCLARSLELCVALLAVLKAGGAYVPLDASYPAERLQYMVSDARVSVVLTQADLAGLLPADVPRVFVDAAAAPEGDGAEGHVPGGEGAPAAGVTPDSLAYVIYTSGSTGRPKGVQVTHGNVTRLFDATAAWFGFGPDDVWTLFHSYAFDFSVWEIWGAWLHGGRLLVVPHAESRSPEAFHALLRQEGVTVLNQTPSAFRGLIDADAAASGQGLALRTVIFGGEALDPTMLRPWFARHGDEKPQLVNMYGITETTVHVTYRPLTAADAEQARSVIGTPIPDLELHVLDAHQELSPIGVPGELYVGGAGVSRGYLDRPMLTEARFLPRASIRGLAGASGEVASDARGAGRLYRSGDLARRLPGGEIEYLGRIDDQIKIRGFRIELGEIEATLAGHPGVRAAAVLVQDGANGHRFLTAYVVPAGKAPSAAELRAHLLARLPEYMVPASFDFLETLPLGENGKLDRRALLGRAQVAPKAAARATFVPPQTPQEALLSEIWADVLGRGPVGIHDSFFDLGGDSILSLRVLSRARQGGLDFTLQQLFKHPTIHELLRVSGGAAQTAPRTEAFALLSPEDRARIPDGVEDAYPLAALQLGMFFHSSLNTAEGVYHDLFSYHLRTVFDEAAFGAALGDVVAAHPILRTGIALTGFSEPLQLVHRAAPAVFDVEDLSALPPEAQDQAISGWFEVEKGRGFEAEKPPLLRVRIHRRGAADFDLSVSFHHAIFDGWSNALFLAELLERYAARRDGLVLALPVEHAQRYRDFVALERRATQRAEDRQHWQQQLADMTLLSLPRWPSTARVKDASAGMASVSIPDAVCEGLRDLARAAGVPLKSALLAAHMRVLAGLANQDDSQTGLVTNGRVEDEGGERVLGLFLNTVPFRLPIRDVSWSTLARQAFEAECALLPFRRYPLSEIQKLSGGERVFETGFNFVHFHALTATAAIEGLELVGVKVFERHNYLLAVIFSLDPLTGKLTVNLVHDTAEIPPAQVAQIAAHYQRTLAAMASAPEASCLSFSPLSAKERAEILARFGRADRGAAVVAGERLAHELFEAQAARTPDATAVVAIGGQGSEAGTSEVLSYRELQARARKLARHLRALGVVPGARVGVFLPRSSDLVVAFLGILGAGGVYVPLDPTYPHDRLQFMLEDAAPRLVLTVEALAGSLPAYAGRVVRLDAEREALAALPQGGLERTVGAEDLAYVIYTSGSTGRPRGVLVPHRGLPNLAMAQSEAFGVTASSRVLQFASPNFDASISELLMALCSGAALYLVDRGGPPSATALLELLKEHAISHVTLPPSLLAVLPDAELPALVTLISAGEACPPALAARWGKGRRFFNAYGPTEATVCASLAEVTAEEATEAVLSIGRPMAGVEVYVLDRRLAPVPVGTPGELCIGGLGVAQGYLNQPALSVEKFVENPFGSGRLYRTGDRARFRSDGRIDFLGRLDEQVKLRGFRIEPEEIRAVLNEHPGVQDSVVVVREAAGAGKQLVAYVTRERNERRAVASVCELWPSTFEFPILDDLLYHAMIADERRMAQYKASIEKVVPGRVVVEVGTGPQAPLAILCAQAGARKVYAIELDAKAHRSAVEHVKRLGLDGVVEVICGDVRTVRLPEPADVCVSALFGSIGGAEGAAAILNGARHLLRPSGVMLPERTTTRIVAVSLPEALRAAPRFSETGRHYVQKIFDHVGHPFDLRLCVSKLPREGVLSGTAVFEDLDFSAEVPLTEEHEIVVRIEKEGRMDGFLLGSHVTFTSGVTLDVLEGEHSHLPVFLPVFDQPVEVEAGDVIRAVCARMLSRDGLHPDFLVRGKLVRKDGTEVMFSYGFPQFETNYKASAFHRRLFERHEENLGISREAATDTAKGTAETAFARASQNSVGGGAPEALSQELRVFLRQKLPDYMIPAAIVELPALPVTPAGKIDRRALPDPEARGEGRKAIAPQDALEREIASIWKEVLQIPEVGSDDNFFDLGGHSLLLMIVLNKLQESRSETLDIVELFEHPTVRALAQHLRKRQAVSGASGARRSPGAAVAGGAAAVAPLGPGASAEEIKRQRLAAREQRRQARRGTSE
ncbi:non-ribosomal peptide synthetase [Chondromyces crocatus]|uniref:Carrier domain-containing protein n=1 Tax=Chondromyces crocatus TaxID=52 RepID=A0A0K1EKP1_CHOCO|nr:non-ribosomal peptide synthetase [Chondromyces crocatus]AKT41227.1 uncharacterized protein CMC5_053880 [Chondromyces crocatus]